MSACPIQKGLSAPLGATVCQGGVNFSVFSKSAEMIELLLFDHENAAKPSKIIQLDPDEHRTYHYWHVYVPHLQPGQIYAYRAYGPFDRTVPIRWPIEAKRARAELEKGVLLIRLPKLKDRRVSEISIPITEKAG